MKSSDWDEHRLMVMDTLQRLESKVDTLVESHQAMKTDLATHKIKSGFWGAFMGAIVAMTAHVVGKGQH